MQQLISQCCRAEIRAIHNGYEEVIGFICPKCHKVANINSSIRPRFNPQEFVRDAQKIADMLGGEIMPRDRIKEIKEEVEKLDPDTLVPSVPAIIYFLNEELPKLEARIQKLEETVESLLDKK